MAPKDPQYIPPPSPSPFPPPPPPPPTDPWDPKYTMGRKPNDPNQSQTNDPQQPPSTVTNTVTAFAATSTVSYQTYSRVPHRQDPPPSMLAQFPNQAGPRHAISAAVMGALGAVVTIVMLLFIAGCCVFLMKRTRRRRAQRMAGDHAQQMSMANANANANANKSVAPDTRAYIRPPSSEPPPTLTSPSTVSASSSRTAPQQDAPILLSNTIDQSYYTGLDTSDSISIMEHRIQPSRDIDATSIAEPPPPYRPRSIPPFSRENSLRMSMLPPYGPRLSVRSQREVIGSPFDDPDPDEEVTPISQSLEHPGTSTPRIRDMEEMSDVSELSYQEEPTQVHSTV